jgi:hypothetical protein
MSTLTAFKDMLDIPEWRPLGVTPNTSAAGHSLAWDERPNELRHPELFQLGSTAILNKYNIKNDAWYALATPALTGTFGVGAGAVFAPSQGPAGTIAAGATTTSVVISTVLPATVGANQLANRGDGIGFTIRIIGNAAGSSGKTEERKIVANTSSTTPTITVDSAFSFTPANGDRYEILSGRVYLLSAGTLAAGMWKYYDIATNSYSGNLSTTNLPATVSTGSNLVCTDEAYVPYTRSSGEGYLVGASTYNGALFGCLSATATAATTLTGQAAAGDAAVATNEYRNFQIRIVEDTGTPTAVGQRRNITSHTAGASPVYTVPAWTVTPSATAKYVIEHNTDRILLWSSASTNTFTYLIAGNTWDTTTFGVRGGAVGAGVSAWLAFGIVKDAQSLNNPGMIYSLRGGAVSTLDVLDITAATAGTWSNAITYGNLSPTFTTGSSAAYIGSISSGRYAYIQQNATPNLMRFDCLDRVLEPYSQLRYAEGVAVEGQKLATTTYIDGSVKLGFVFKLRNTGTEFFENLITR